MDKEQIIALAKELKSGSNWLSGKHDVYSYNRAPKVAALVLEAIAEYNIQHLVTVLRDANKWKLEGFGHFKDVTMSENDAPFRAADVIEATINAAIESYKVELLKEAGEPTCRVSTTGIITNQTNAPLEPGLELYTADQLIAARKGLEEEIERLSERRCEICGYAEHHREHTGCLRKQIEKLTAERDAALAKLSE